MEPILSVAGYVGEGCRHSVLRALKATPAASIVCRTTDRVLREITRTACVESGKGFVAVPEMCELDPGQEVILLFGTPGCEITQGQHQLFQQYGMTCKLLLI